MTDGEEMKHFLNSPWINRVLLGILIYLAQGMYSDNHELKANVSAMKTDIEVLKKEIQILTDYKVDPKK